VKKPRRVLGIESSCDETGAAVVAGPDRVLSNIVASSLKKHARYGGVIPEIAARAHVASIVPVVEEALAKARFKAKDIDAIAVTEGPGLIALGGALVRARPRRRMGSSSDRD
jgi:N6-L-threonylcarbamoyladenine synthase